jgi:hypothetical protein
MFYIVKRTVVIETVYFSKICNHTTFLDATLNITTTSQVCALAMFILPIVGNLKVILE